MSQPQIQSNVRAKLFMPQQDVESVILNLITEIGMSALKVKDVGDAGQAQTVFIMSVMNLDNFVYPLLTSHSEFDWGDYTEKRDSIVNEIGENSPTLGQARNLYKLTIEVLSKHRLFKMRRQTYFGIGWTRYN